MGRAPAFQFYVKDWLSDPKLRATSPSTRGIWIDLLCYMFWEATGGQFEGTLAQIAKITGANDKEVALFVEEAKRFKFCDLELCHTNVTPGSSVTSNAMSQICHIKNRRMYKEAKIREFNRKRQRAYRASHKNNAPVTSYSPYPSNKYIKRNAKKNPDNDFRNYPDVEEVLRKKGMQVGSSPSWGSSKKE